MKQSKDNSKPQRSGLLHHESPGLSEIRRVVILRALPGLGDFLCAVPALRALREALPKARIDLLGLASTRQLVDRYSHYIDGQIDLPGFPCLPEQTPQVANIPPFLTTMQSRQYDLALQLHGDGTVTNVLTLLLGARYTAGFYLLHQMCPDARTFMPYPDDRHEIQRNTALVRFLGAPVKDESYEFPLTPRDFRAFEHLARRHNLKSGSYACIHAGSSSPARRWPQRSFAQCAQLLHERGLRIVLTGSRAEAAENAALSKQISAPVLDLSGQTDLGSLALLLCNAELLLSNDTGVSHLGAAMRTPSVVIFTGSDAVRWAPPDHARHIPIGSGDGTAASTAHVVRAIDKLLRKREVQPKAIRHGADAHYPGTASP